MDQVLEQEFDKVSARWRIEPRDLELGDVIGQGSFGVVRVGTLREGNNRVTVAVKQLPILNNVSKDEWHKLMQEALVFAKASERCKSTCRLYGICLMQGNFCLVMKKYVTSLDDKLNSYPERKAPEEMVQRWMLDICQGVAELHAQNIIMRDLKPANVLLDEFGHAIIADFGISRIVLSTLAQFQTKSQAGTPAYMAPEMFDDDLGVISAKADIWALGCLLLELQTGSVPWKGLSTVRVITQVYTKKNSPSIPDTLSRQFVDTLHMCFTYEASERASAMDILEALRGAFRRSSSEEQFSNSHETSIGSSSVPYQPTHAFPKTSSGREHAFPKTSSGREHAFPKTSSGRKHAFPKTSSGREHAFPKTSSGTEYVSGNSSNATSSRALHYSKFVSMDSIWFSDTTKLKLWAWLGSPGDDIQYVLLAHSSDHMTRLEVGVYTSHSGFNPLHCPSTIKHDIDRHVNPVISGHANMLFVVTRAHKSYVLVWRRRKFFCEVIQPDDRAMYPYCALAVSPSGTLYCGCSDGMIEVWKSHSNQPYFLATKLGEHSDRLDRERVKCLGVDKNDILCSLDGVEGTVKVWHNLIQVAVLNLSFDQPISMACTEEGKLYILMRKQRIMWCELEHLVHSGDPSARLGWGTRQVLGFGPEILGNLHDVSSGCTGELFSIRTMPGLDMIVGFWGSINNRLFSMQAKAWCGGECIATLDTCIDCGGDSTYGSFSRFYRCGVDRNGIVNFRTMSEIHRWKLG